jgi:hypothetical protein
MTFIELYGKEAVPIITWFLNSRLRPKARLVFANPHAFKFFFPEPLFDAQGKQLRPHQSMHTRSLVINNDGKLTATRIEVVFNWKPQLMNLWPVRPYTDHTQADARYTMRFDSLAPSEHFTLEIVAVNADLPDVITLRCDQCVGAMIETYPQRVLPNWHRRLAIFLVFAGMAAVVYVLILVLQFVIVRTPLG